MTDHGPPSDNDKYGIGNFSEDDQSRRDRLNRLTQDKGPTTAASTSRWQTLGDGGEHIGSRHFDSTRIPLVKLEQMRRDPMIAFGLMFIKVFLARAPWYIKSSDPQRAAFIDGALRRIYGRFVLQYCGSLDFGFQALVKNFERVDPSEIEGWQYMPPGDPEAEPKPAWSSSAQPLIWKPFTALNPRHSVPAFNKAGAFNGINLKPYAPGVAPNFSTDKPDIELDWALWVTNEKDSVYGSLYGYPRTGYAYRYWWAYWYRFGLADRAFERWADAPIIAYHPVDIATDESGNLRDYTLEALGLAEKLRSGANVSLPSGVVESMIDGKTSNVREWELKQMEATVDFAALNTAFEYLDIAKLRSLMVPEQAFLEGRGGTSSRNVAATLGDVFEEQQAVIKAEIDDQINRYVIPQILEANFGPGGPTCEIVTTGFDQQDLETARALVQAFAQNDPKRLASIDFRKVLKRLGIEQLDVNATKKQADQMQEDMIKATQGARPPATPPVGGNAGVNKAGLYYTTEEGEVITLQLEDEEVGFFERLKTRLRSPKEEEPKDD